MDLKLGKLIPLFLLRGLKGRFPYVDDIIFGSSNKAFNDEFSKLMTDRFEMSMMGELKFFLGFEIKQLRGGTFISQAKYIQDMLKRFNMADAKENKTPMDEAKFKGIRCQL